MIIGKVLCWLVSLDRPSAFLGMRINSQYGSIFNDVLRKTYFFRIPSLVLCLMPGSPERPYNLCTHMYILYQVVNRVNRHFVFFVWHKIFPNTISVFPWSFTDARSVWQAAGERTWIVRLQTILTEIANCAHPCWTSLEDMGFKNIDSSP